MEMILVYFLECKTRIFMQSRNVVVGIQYMNQYVYNQAPELVLEW